MASSSAENGLNQASQYHHFIPRFLLTNFAVFKNPGNIKPRMDRGKKKPAPKPSRLNLLDFATGTLTQQDVGRTFGFVDMYKDVASSTSDPFDLEKRLSRLENDASKIISDIKRAHDSGRGDVHLKRQDKDLLRRFLFIMLYRNRTLARRYEKSTEEYDANDKETMLEYIREHGFHTPRDVWFSNIRAFLEIDMSGEWHEWYSELNRRVYPSDARWFFKNMQMSFLALCTPSTAEDEFILTQDAYSVFEGPQSPNGAWTDYHVFAPISPRLMMVTRSVLLPNGNLEGEDSEQARLQMLEVSRSMHIDPSSADSILEDLPVAKAHNNYSKLVDGKLVPLPTKMSRDKHVFYFKFFPIQANHVQTINMVLLEEALGTVGIIYKSPAALRLALEFYLSSERLGFKTIIKKANIDLPDHVPLLNGEIMDTRHEENRIPYLLLLEKIARTLGSTTTAKYTMIDLNDMNRNNPGIAKLKELHKNEKEMDPGNSNFKQLYNKLAGNLYPSSFIIDFQQAELVMRLIGITDSIINCSDASLKGTIRKNREDLICSLPPQRVWLLVKIMRNWTRFRESPSSLEEAGLTDSDEIEDALAQAHSIFRPSALCRLMYRVVDIEIFLNRHPGFGIHDGELSVTDIFEEKALMFDRPGSIRDCGIPVLEEALAFSSQQYQAFKQIYPQGAGERTFYRFLSEEQIQEIWTRSAIALSFEDLLKNLLTIAEVEALKQVMFKHLYRSDFGGRVPWDTRVR
ncbi:hypothetical protein G7Y79_00057g090890 [Physcia stellaris]|nr:hypothetical protein G7Y79_00057g090890 [Physcia stellaris]